MLNFRNLFLSVLIIIGAPLNRLRAEKISLVLPDIVMQNFLRQSIIKNKELDPKICFENQKSWDAYDADSISQIRDALCTKSKNIEVEYPNLISNLFNT